jgi:hypothetical protein
MSSVIAMIAVIPAILVLFVLYSVRSLLAAAQSTTIITTQARIVSAR